jgi:hypothetical protein
MKTERKYDYLKYWRVIRYYIKARYKISPADLDMMLFLYSEQYFDKDKFAEFNNLLPWDKYRFYRLLKNDWIVVFRKKSGPSRALYEISYKGSRMIHSMYMKLNGEEIITGQLNPMFNKNVSYSDKIYRNMILDMNAFIKKTKKEKQTE